MEEAFSLEMRCGVAMITTSHITQQGAIHIKAVRSRGRNMRPSPTLSERIRHEIEKSIRRAKTPTSSAAAKGNIDEKSKKTDSAEVPKQKPSPAHLPETDIYGNRNSPGQTAYTPQQTVMQPDYLYAGRGRRKRPYRVETVTPEFQLSYKDIRDFISDKKIREGTKVSFGSGKHFYAKKKEMFETHQRFGFNFVWGFVLYDLSLT